MKTGTSLIELLIAISVITLTLVTLASVASRSISVQLFSTKQAQATKLAEEQVDRVRAYRDRSGFAALSCADKCSLNAQITPAPTPLVVTPFTIWYEITEPGGCPTPLPTLSQTDPKEVTAIAQWTDAQPTPHQSQITTCLSDWR